MAKRVKVRSIMDINLPTKDKERVKKVTPINMVTVST